ncbi:hypothetical protein Clacol_005355 [Clathrus columnatus]|uniref:Apurinic-apyrimidinic endonuclease 1 n=1 Tax=Clathrus columnatus TaxID=1419009 RepID=A0AAV5AEI1_9AGAM|nr:hypothetical protein Clacol_005355 [Clathrus columnatus]
MAAPSLRRSTRVRSSSTTALISSLHTAVSTSSNSSPRKRIKVEIESNASISSPSITRRKTVKVKLEKESISLEDYPKRLNLEWKVGAHVSAAGGVENAILNAASIGANAFALFVKSQRKWTSPPLSPESIRLFKSRLRQFDYHPDFVLPHGSYLINVGNPDKDKREKSYECLFDDLKRCESLGLTRYNFHPGSTVGVATKEESIKHIADCINRAHRETSQIVIVIENMAGSGNVLGSKFEEIAQIIELVDDKSRIGTCLDTCHTFAAGHEEVTEFDRTIGLQYLRGMHLNDSKATLASRKDRHDNIGLGELKLPTFSFIMRDSRLRNIPLILETPISEDSDVWKQEIEVLNTLCQQVNYDVEGLVNSILDVTNRSKKKLKPVKRRRDDMDADEEPRDLAEK